MRSRRDRREASACARQLGGGRIHARGALQSARGRVSPFTTSTPLVHIPRPGADEHERDSRHVHRCGCDRRRLEPEARRPRRSPSATSSSAIQDLSVAYGIEPRAQRRQPRHLQEPDHRDDRPVGLRQEHLHPLPEPDERPRPRASRSAARSSTTARTSTGRRPTRSRFAGGSGWSSSGRTRSRSRSTTTSPSPRKVLGMKRRTCDERVEQRAARARRSGTRSRTGSSGARSRSRAASSSGSASRARSRSSPR